MEFFIKEDNGTAIVREFIGSTSLSENVIKTFKEAKSSNKDKLLVTIAGIHEGITRNYTEYTYDALEKSIKSWTSPYNVPTLVNHSQYDVNSVIGRVVNVQMGKHNGKNVLLFTSEITDEEAAEKIADGRYYSVSVGSRIRSATCSICGADVTKTWCDHHRGSYYLEDDTDPKSKKKLCRWVMQGIEGLEISYVAVPADKNAMTIAINKPKSTKKEDLEAVETLDDELCSRMFMLSESGNINTIDKDGNMEHVGDEPVAEEVKEETNTEVEASESEATDEEIEEGAETDKEEVVEEKAGEELIKTDEAAEEEITEEAAVEETADTILLSEHNDKIATLKEMLKDTKLELLLSVKGIESDSDEGKELLERYGCVDEDVIDDLIRGERASKKVIGLASIKNSVQSPVLTEDPVEKPHNPSGESSNKKKVRIIGTESVIEITPKEGRGKKITSIKVRK